MTLSARVRRGLTAVLIVLALVVVCGQPAVVRRSPAQEQIIWADAALRKRPDQAQPYTDLALALTRRARETGDPAFYRDAEEALQHAFRIAPADFEAEKVNVRILLGRHQFARALDAASALTQRAGDDTPVYALIADAAIALGRYDEAESAVQQMIDLRRAGAAGLVRVARLRELFGDVEGAIEVLSAALEMVSTNEVEERAWILTRMGRLELMRGRPDPAAQRLLRALELFPDYHETLAALARVRSAQKRHAEAVDLLTRAQTSAPCLAHLYALAMALEKAQKSSEARAAFADFERQANAVVNQPFNSNRELTFYYASQKPADALRVARREAGRRRDVDTVDAYAWALYANGRVREAHEQMTRAIDVGIRDADMMYRAGVILWTLNDRAAAVRLWKGSLEINPFSDSVEDVRAALARQRGVSGGHD